MKKRIISAMLITAMRNERGSSGNGNSCRVRDRRGSEIRG